jgi:hypothetical protein
MQGEFNIHNLEFFHVKDWISEYSFLVDEME